MSTVPVTSLNALAFPESHSSLDLFTTCPFWYKAQYVDRALEYVPSKATEMGNIIHKLAEMYVQQLLYGNSNAGDAALNTKLSDDQFFVAQAMVRASLGVTLEEVAPHWDNVANLLSQLPIDQYGIKANVEASLACAFVKDVQGNVSVKRALYNDKIPNAHLRARIDLLLTTGSMAMLLDYKSGKSIKDNGQLMRNALLVLACYPHIDVVYANLYSTRGLKPIKLTFTRTNLTGIIKIVMSTMVAVANARATSTFEPTPNGLCKAWCPVKHCRNNGNFIDTPTEC